MVRLPTQGNPCKWPIYSIPKVWVRFALGHQQLSKVVGGSLIHCLVRTIPAIRLAPFNAPDRLDAVAGLAHSVVWERRSMKLLRFRSPSCPGRYGGSQWRAVSRERT